MPISSRLVMICEKEETMVITFVIDMFGSSNNGTTVTCMRTARVLKSHGHDVKVIAFIPENHDDLSMYKDKILPTERFVIPVFDKLVLDNGMVIAKADPNKIAEFIKGSDVVHCMLPFSLEDKVRKVAKVMGIPVTAAFHVQPENVSYNLKLGKCKPVNALIYLLFKTWLYRYVRYVHTPSLMMKDQMEKHHYHNKIYAISNGVSPRFKPTETERPEELKGKYVILMIGRYSGEKRQDLIFKAIGHSKYNDKIQLILCGQGPLLKKYQKLSKKYLANPCRFGFMSQEQLAQVINYSDLYIHSSDAESEAISCIEAFSCGLVPIISDSKLSATNNFALDEKCLFKAGSYRSLTKRIEYFIEHKEIVDELSSKYVEYGKSFALEDCVSKLEDMFVKAIEDEKKDQEEKVSYYTSRKERKNLRKIADQIGYDYKYIYSKRSPRR